MLEDWRAKFHAASFGITSPIFPFGIVQLAPWSAGGKDGNNDCGQSHDCEVAQVRWGQTANVGNVLNNTLLPNTFMAVTTDLADFVSNLSVLLQIARSKLRLMQSQRYLTPAIVVGAWWCLLGLAVRKHPPTA